MKCLSYISSTKPTKTRKQNKGKAKYIARNLIVPQKSLEQTNKICKIKKVLTLSTKM